MSHSFAIPDIVLPSQFFERSGAAKADQPEKRLMLAVLLDAITSLRQARSSHKYGEAERWVRGDSMCEWLYSFNNICEALELDPDYMRHGLLTPAANTRRQRYYRRADSGRSRIGRRRRKKITATHEAP